MAEKRIIFLAIAVFTPFCPIDFFAKRKRRGDDLGKLRFLGLFSPVFLAKFRQFLKCVGVSQMAGKTTKNG